jgi:hypothetical protein
MKIDRRINRSRKQQLGSASVETRGTGVAPVDPIGRIFLGLSAA